MSLQNFFKPAAVAVIGASSDKAKIGRQILDNIISGGFKGKIYPINLKEKKIADLDAYADLNDLPKGNPEAILVVIAIPLSKQAAALVWAWIQSFQQPLHIDRAVTMPPKQRKQNAPLCQNRP